MLSPVSEIRMLSPDLQQNCSEINLGRSVCCPQINPYGVPRSRRSVCCPQIFRGALESPSDAQPDAARPPSRAGAARRRHRSRARHGYSAAAPRPARRRGPRLGAGSRQAGRRSGRPRGRAPVAHAFRPGRADPAAPARGSPRARATRPRRRGARPLDPVVAAGAARQAQRAAPARAQPRREYAHLP